MKKTFILLLILFLALPGLWACQKPVPTNAVPEVVAVGPYSVTIAWTGTEPYKGKIFYQQATAAGEPERASEPVAGTRAHEVGIRGLAPATRYTYWIEGSEARYQFQTQPKTTDPFSFALAWDPASVEDIMFEEMPEFFVSVISRENPGESDSFQLVRPYVPVFGWLGPDSPYLKEFGRKPEKGPYKLDWGGLRLVLATSTPEPGPAGKKLFDHPSAHTFGIILGPEADFPMDRPQAVADSSLHRAMLAHNARHPDRPAAFVGKMGATTPGFELNGVQYFGFSGEGDNSGYGARVDVDVDSARMVFLGADREVALKKPPIQKKITCAECRRLADRGTYEAAVKAYQSFIENNQGHFQIDDAYFAIAEILDEKLFRFPQALTWYQRLIKEYPDGTLTPLAQQRVEYLNRYSAYDFKPLASFERIKKTEWGRKKDNPTARQQILDQVEKLAGDYPDSALAPVMRYWLANQYREVSVDQAVLQYEKLLADFPNHALAQDAPVEIGAAYYTARRYPEAKKAYEKALSALPDQAGSIQAQIKRCNRNMRRVYLTWAAWALAGLALVLALFRPPFGLVFRFRRTLVAWLILLACFGFGAWMISEQFASDTEMIQMVLGLSFSTVLASALSNTLARKWLGGKSGEALLAGFLGVALFFTFIYLILYYLNPHYLIIAGM